MLHCSDEGFLVEKDMREQKDPCEEQTQLEHRNVTILLNGPAFITIPLVRAHLA